MEPRNRRIFWQRPRTENGLLKNIRLGLINATTLNGKEEEIVELMIERSLDILGICEARMLGRGSRVIHENYQLVYIGKFKVKTFRSINQS